MLILFNMYLDDPGYLNETCDKFNELRAAHENKEFEKFPFCNSCDQLYTWDDALVYSTIKSSKVGKTNTNQFQLENT